MSMEMEFEMSRGPKRFSYGELVSATNNFAEEFKLGEGGFGGVYKGLLKDPSNSYVAVKRVSKSSKQGKKEYAARPTRNRRIVALDIAAGRKPIDARAKPNEVRSVEWVWELYGRGAHLEAADPKLSGDYDEHEMGRLLVVGLWCAHPDSSLRPSIRQAIQVLGFEAEPPLLPSKLPMPTYSAPPPSSLTSLFSQKNNTDSSGYSNVSINSNVTSSSVSSSSPSASLLYSK